MMEKVSLRLDPSNFVIKNWEYLASELRAPKNVKAQCRRSTHHSLTRVLFEKLSTLSDTKDLTVSQLITISERLNRNDVKLLLEEKICGEFLTVLLYSKKTTLLKLRHVTGLFL